MKLITCLVFAVANLALVPPSAHAAGKKRQQEPGPFVFSAPSPVRKTQLRAVGTQPFALPSGARVDLSADLATLLSTAVTATPSFSPTDPGAPAPCDTHLEIRAAVTTLELNVAELGVTFGYTPSGESNTLTDLSGKLNVRVGTIAMDFSVWECVGTSCSAVAAATSSHLTAGVGLSLELDLGVVKTGPSLIWNTPLGPILRSIMNDGMSRLASSRRLHELSWSAKVREVDVEGGSLIFDAGARSRLGPNQTFTVYAALPESGSCDVYKVVASIHTTQVDAVSSVAAVDRVFGARGIREGDLVMVKSQ